MLSNSFICQAKVSKYKDDHKIYVDSTKKHSNPDIINTRALFPNPKMDLNSKNKEYLLNGK